LSCAASAGEEAARGQLARAVALRKHISDCGEQVAQTLSRPSPFLRARKNFESLPADIVDAEAQGIRGQRLSSFVRRRGSRAGRARRRRWRDLLRANPDMFSPKVTARGALGRLLGPFSAARERATYSIPGLSNCDGCGLWAMAGTVGRDRAAGGGRLISLVADLYHRLQSRPLQRAKAAGIEGPKECAGAVARSSTGYLCSWRSARHDGGAAAQKKKKKK